MDVACNPSDQAAVWFKSATMCIRFDPCPLDELWSVPHDWGESDEEMDEEGEEEEWEEESGDDGCWCGARLDPTLECLCQIPRQDVH